MTTGQLTIGTSSQDYGRGICQTSDGSYLITGSLRNSAGNDDAFIAKLNENGDTIWTRGYGGSSADIGYRILETSGGDIAVLGYTSSYGAGSYDLYLLLKEA